MEYIENTILSFYVFELGDWGIAIVRIHKSHTLTKGGISIELYILLSLCIYMNCS